MGVEYDLYNMAYLISCPKCGSNVRVPRYYLTEFGRIYDRKVMGYALEKITALNFCSCSSKAKENKEPAIDNTTPKIRKIRFCTQVHKKESNGNESPLRYL